MQKVIDAAQPALHGAAGKSGAFCPRQQR